MAYVLSGRGLDTQQHELECSAAAMEDDRQRAGDRARFSNAEETFRDATAATGPSPTCTASSPGSGSPADRADAPARGAVRR